jgi:hypothetical protein
MGAPMTIKFVSAEFLDTDNPGRVSKCREFAAKAGDLAAAAHNAEMRAAYLELKRQWIMLADEIELSETTASPRVRMSSPAH